MCCKVERGITDPCEALEREMVSGGPAGAEPPLRSGADGAR